MKRKQQESLGVDKMQRPIKAQKHMTDTWLEEITRQSTNKHFSQFLSMLKSDIQLESLLYCHKEFLETLGEMPSLTTEQMLCLLIASEKEYMKEETIRKRLKEETAQRIAIESELEELKNVRLSESDVNEIRAINRNLTEENKELLRVAQSQGEYLRESRQMQEELMNIKEENFAMTKNKNELIGDMKRSKQLIDELKQEMSLLQAEKESLAKRFASSISSKNSKLNSSKDNKQCNNPLEALEESKLDAQELSTEKPLKTSRSFDSSLKYNDHLANLLMNKELKYNDSQDKENKMIYANVKDAFVRKDKRKQELNQRQNLISIIRELRKENKELTYKLKELERQYSKSLSDHYTFAGNELTCSCFQSGDNNRKYADILNLIADIANTLHIHSLEYKLATAYNKDKEMIDKIKNCLFTIKEQVMSKKQIKEFQWEKLEKRRIQNLNNNLANRIQYLESELNMLRNENKTLKNVKYHNNEFMVEDKLRRENVSLMQKYKEAMGENFGLRVKLKHELPNDCLCHKGAVNGLCDCNLKLEELLLKQRTKLARISEQLEGFKERNQLLKEELLLQKDKNRELERQILKYIKANTNLSTQAIINKHNYKARKLSNKLKLLQKENLNTSS